MEFVKLIECIRTWQGEGPDTGKQMLLCRFKKCQLNCSFCDTMVRMNNTIEGNYSICDLQQIIDKTNSGLLITGGEPTLYIDEVSYLLNNLEYNVANVETNGFKLKELILGCDIKKNIKFMFSPKHKLESDDIKHYLNNDKVYYKFVIDKYDSDSFSNNFQSLKLLKLSYKNLNNVYLMPKGVTISELKTNSKIVFDLAEKFNCNVSSRLHLIYNFI